MKTTVLLLFTLFLCAFAGAQVPVLYYDFESNASRTTLETSPEQSINIGSSVFERYYNPPTPITMAATGAGLVYGGTSAGTAFTSNKWPKTDPGGNAKDYFSFSTSTAGFGGLTLSFDALCNQAGMSVAVAWSTGSGGSGSSFTVSTTGALAVPTAGFSKLQFVLPAAAENQSALYFKIYAFNSSNENAATFTVDNLTLSATTVTATKTLLNYPALGTCLTSGSAYEPSYNDLTVANAGTIASLGGNLKLQGSLSLSAGTLELGSNTLSMNGTISKGSGLINAAFGTMSFGGASAQTLSPTWFTGNINNLTINNSAGVTATGNLTVSNFLTLTTGTFSLGSNTLTLGGSISRTSGAVNASSGGVVFNGTTAQSIAASSFTGSINNLTINNVAGVTSASDLTVSGPLTLTAGTLALNSSTLTIGGSITRTNGAITASSAAVVFAGSNAQSIATGVFNSAINNLTINNNQGVNTVTDLSVSNLLTLTTGTLSLGSNTLTVGGSVNRTSGAIDAASATVVFNGSATQSIAANVFSGSINNLTINNTAGVNTAADATITGTLALTAGTYNIGFTTQTIKGNITRTNGTLDASTGSITLNGSTAQTITAGVFSAPVKNLTINNTAGVNTAANATITGTLSLTAGTFNISSSTLTLSGSTTVLAGLMNASTGTLVFNGSAAQAVSPSWFSGSINNLTINNAAGVTASGSLTVSNVLLLTAGTFSLGTTTLSIGGIISRTGGVISAASATVVFNGTAAQTIAAGIFSGSVNNLTVNNTAGVTTAADATISGTLSLTAGTYNITTSTQTLSGSISQGTGTINATSGTFVYSGLSEQILTASHFSGAIKNLTINNPMLVSLSGNLVISNTVALTGGTLSLGTATLSVGGNINRTSGVMDASSATVVFNGTAAQTIAAGIFSGSVNNLTVNNTAGVTTAADATISGTLALTAGIFSIGSTTQTIKGNITRTGGAIDAASGAISFSGTSPQSIAAGSFLGSINNLTVSNSAGVLTAADVTITGTLSLTSGTYNIGSSTQTMKGGISATFGKIDAASGTMNFGGSSAQTISPSWFTGSINNLTISNAAGVTATGNLTVSNLLTLTAGTFSLGSTTLAIGGSISRTSGAINASSGGVVFNGTATQNIAASSFTGSINNLTINNAAGVASLADATISGTLALTTGTYNIGSTIQTIKGNITRTNGTLNASSGTMVFNGSSTQTIAANVFSGNINNLNINNPAGVTTAADVTISGTLVLAGGTLNLNTTSLTILGNINATVGTIDASAGNLVFSGAAEQKIAAGAFYSTVKNLTINNTAGVTTNANTTITGVLTLSAGTYNIGSSTQTITGTINRVAGIMNASSGFLVFSGSSAQSIPAGAVTLSIGNLTVNNTSGVTINENHTISAALVLQSGTLNLNGKTITLGGTVSGSGTFKGSATSGLTIAAAATAGTLNFDQANDGATNALGTLSIISGTAFLGGKLHVYVALNIAGGVLDLAAKNLVLKSTSAQTAYVAEIKGTLNGETNVTVERYIPAWSSRRWRLVTSPLMNTSINAAWQEGSAWNGSSSISANGYGTLITGQQQGTVTTANTKGFDYWTAIANSASSLRYYSSGATGSQASWQPVSSTLTPDAFNNHQAYLLFVRGDRSVYSGTAAGATTIRPKGTLKKGSFTISVPKTASHTLIGNPYASPLDFKTLYDANSTKIQSSFYVWQAPLGTGGGGYVLMRPVAPGSSLYEAIPGNGTASAANRLIHSAEGFFVMPAASATATNTITVQESHKSTGTPAVSIFRQMGSADAKLYVNLYDGADMNSGILLDGVLSQYNDIYGSNSSDNNIKAINTSENLSISKTASDYIVTSGAVPQPGDTLKLRLWNTTARTYQLQLRTANFAGSDLAAVLVDKYLAKETPMDLNDETTAYTFNVTSNAASKDPSRFFIVYKAATITLPLAITSMKAEALSNKLVRLQWKVSDERDIKSYQVEKATEPADFATLATLESKAGVGEKLYEYLDNQPAKMNYYRVKLFGLNGEVKYSGIVKVQLQTAHENVSVYPNPLTGRTLNLSMVNKPAGNYNVSLYNMAGQEVLSRTIRHSGGTAMESIELGSSFAAGLYRLCIRNEAGVEEMLGLTVGK